MATLKIDGKRFTAQKGSTILEVAREHDISIPTLCYYEEVSPSGKCRLCAVEIISPKKQSPVVLACMSRVEDGLEVLTQSKPVLASRKRAMRSLLEKAPCAEKIQQMAREIGIGVVPSDPKDRGDDCIACGLCARACEEVVGRGAIHMIPGRSTQKRKGAPIQVTPERCIACGTCAYLCPTGLIKMEDHEGVRVIWDRIFKEKEHLISGRFFSPVDRSNIWRRRANITSISFKTGRVSPSRKKAAGIKREK